MEPVQLLMFNVFPHFSFSAPVLTCAKMLKYEDCGHKFQKGLIIIHVNSLIVLGERKKFIQFLHFSFLYLKLFHFSKGIYHHLIYLFFPIWNCYKFIRELSINGGQRGKRLESFPDEWLLPLQSYPFLIFSLCFFSINGRFLLKTDA